MYIVALCRRRFVGVRLYLLVLAAVAVSVLTSTRVHAQGPEHEHDAHATAESEHAGHETVDMARDGSGTSWLPDESPMYARHSTKGSWTLMFHENAFLQYLHDSGERGDDQLGSINWVMGMAQRDVGRGRLGLRGMFSAEPWSIRGCGYPDLLATGEECRGEKIHDRQHPHDLFMELAADYNAPIAGGLRWQVYGGPAGEPALGPVAYPHRVSAMANPLAPITHHWLDSTHITFGVVTGGVYSKKWKAEASLFNGREPDEDRTNFDFSALDSVSGRVWFLPTPQVALQVSAGRLKDAEAGDGGAERINVNRVTASATYHRAFRDNSIFAATVAWGRNAEPDHASNALLVETNFTVDQRDTWFGRFEVAGKSAYDLDVAERPGDFTVAKLQGGYTRYLPDWDGFQPGLGAGLSLGIVPDALRSAYGSRANVGFAVYLTLRPSAMMHGGGGTATAPVDHSQHVVPQQPAAQSTTPPGARRETPSQTERPAAEPRLPVLEAERVVDPACASTIDLVNGPKASYQGKVYYFCSAAERDAFVKDPAAYLKARGK